MKYYGFETIGEISFRKAYSDSDKFMFIEVYDVEGNHNFNIHINLSFGELVEVNRLIEYAKNLGRQQGERIMQSKIKNVLGL